MEKRVISDFIKETCSNSPTPGGGSVAALLASLSMSLAAMSANLAINEIGCGGVRGGVKRLALN